MAQVDVLYPSDEVRTYLAAANTGEGYAALSAAVDACRNRAELRWAILNFRRWSREADPAGEDLTTAWADLSAFADISARLATPGAPFEQWLDLVSAESEPRAVSPESTVHWQPLEHAFKDAFAESAESSKRRREAASALGFSRVPHQWAPLAMALRSEPHIEDQLLRLLGHSPYEGLEENLNALQEALPPPASHGEDLKRLEPDAATSRRLRRLLALCMARLAVAFESRTTTLTSGTDPADSDGSALVRRFGLAVQRAVVRACHLLWNPEALPPDPSLCEWWGCGQGRGEFLTGHKAQMLDLLAVGMPLPGALRALLLEQVSDILLCIDKEDIQEEVRNTILVASLTDEEKAVSELLSQAKEAGDALLLGHIALAQTTALALGLRRRALPNRVLQRLAWQLSLTWDPPATSWQDDWVSRWWFAAYQARMRETRCLPSPLAVVDSLESDAAPTQDYFGLEPGEVPPSDVDASALWFLWCCLRDSFDLIPDPDRDSNVWPDCIRRLGKDGFFSTALCLFECWLVHQAIYIEHAFDRGDEESQAPVDNRPDIGDHALPSDETLIALVKELQSWTSSGRLDGVLHFTAGRLESCRGRFAYLAEQLKALAATTSMPARFQTTAIIHRIERIDSDRMLVRERLREQMVGYDRLPTDFQNELAEAERVRDLLFGDSMSGEANTSRWATTYGQLAERAVRDAFGRLGERALAQMYQAGGGKEWRSAKSLTLGQLRYVLTGASSRPEWQDLIKEQRIAWDELHKTWRDRLRWIKDLRNLAVHADRLSRENADAWRRWMYSDFGTWIEPLGLLQSGS